MWREEPRVHLAERGGDRLGACHGVSLASLSLLPVIAASALRSRRGALQVGALSAALYLGVVVAQYSADWRIAPDIDLPTVRFAQFTVAINLFGLLAVALLSGSLAERLRSTGVRLVDASNEIADLRAFNEHVIDSLLSGLATTEHLEERVRLGWQRFCETGGHAAVSDFRGATDGKVSPSGTPWDHKVLFEGLKHSK